MATEIGHRIADLADGIDAQGKTTFATRLRECSWQISGILADGSSCPTKLEFADFVGRARGATLEIANLIIFFGERELITEVEEAAIVNMLKRESKMLDNFRQSLERADPRADHRGEPRSEPRNDERSSETAVTA